MVKKILFGLIILVLVAFIYLKLTSSSEFDHQNSPAPNSPIAMFDKSAVIFDAVTIFGTEWVPIAKLEHAAQVTAQWLDNDEDGEIDDQKLKETLIQNNPVVLMSKDGFSTLAMLKIAYRMSDYSLQDLSAEETNNPTRRDASQEEIHHIITNAGWEKLMPSIFSDEAKDNSKLYNIWKYANDNGHYDYDDPTCNDACKTIEFFYLATAAYLNSQADLFSDEMRLKTVAELEETIPEIIEIFESKDYVYPIHKWPNGKYEYANNIKYWGKTENPPMSVLSELGEDLPGYQIAFASPRVISSDQDIWIIGTNGTDERNLTESLSGGYDIYPEWTPDAKYIYYTSNKHKGETLELYRVNTVGDPRPRQITQLGKEVRSLSISPENRHIALGVMSNSVSLGADLKPYSADLYILDINKIEERLSEQKFVELADLHLLLSEPMEKHIWHEQPDWEPSKSDALSRIAYVRTQNYDNDPIMVDEIWTTYMDGSNNQIVLKDHSMPRWSHDGKKIVTHEFSIIDVGSKQVKEFLIDNLKNDAGSASLSPDQNYVLFETSDSKRQGGIAKAIFNGDKDVTPNPFELFSKREMYEPRWSPIAIPSNKI